jgi:type IV pilus assembly protein PilV
MTLIEVLIAAVVIGIGLLGVASMQVTALQGASNADSRSRATELAASLGDRMRANLDGVAASHYYTTEADGEGVNCDASPENQCAMRPDDTDDSGVATCGIEDMAAFDLWEIRCRNGVHNSLPGGRLSVICLDNNGNTVVAANCPELARYVVTISWQIESSETDPETEKVVTTILPGAP